MTDVYLSPTTGAPLRPDGPNSLAEADGRRWPVLDGIPFLRVGRDRLVAEALSAIDRGDLETALVALLTDQDDWWSGPTPADGDLRTLVAERDGLTLRAAMDRLAYGRVGDYFAHRWSDPTFLAGLGLLESHWRPAARALELACGIGHYLRELAQRGVLVTGLDVVFSKLWLARHWVVGPDATLVCCDAAAPWPLPEERAFDLVFCHDAFYFLSPKDDVLARLRARTAAGGRLAVGHVHNREAANMSAGHAVSAADMAAFFPDGCFYDDAELTAALVDARVPRSAPLAALRGVEAFACEDRPSLPHALVGGLAMPPDHAPLRLNPLYVEDGGALAIRWPSARYRAEYAAGATFPLVLAEPPTGEAAVRRRVLVDLPERW